MSAGIATGYGTGRARAREENFPVASRVLSRRVRTQLMAVYGFARLTDDVGDEAPGDRSAQLDELEAELDEPELGESDDEAEW